MSKFRKPLLLTAGLLLASTAVVFGGDVAAGKKVFGKCVACHMVGENAKHKVGPALNDVVGRQAGTAEGYNYSPAMKKPGLAGSSGTTRRCMPTLPSPGILSKAPR